MFKGLNRPMRKRNCEGKNFGNLTRRKNKRMDNERFLRIQLHDAALMSFTCYTYRLFVLLGVAKTSGFQRKQFGSVNPKIFPFFRLSVASAFQNSYILPFSGFHLLVIFWAPDTPPPQRTSTIFWPRKPRRQENLQVKLQVGRFEGRVLARSFRGPMIVEVLSS